MKAYALRKQKSVSELVELYFEAVTRPAKRRTVIDLVEDLKRPELDSSIDLKELFYKEQAKKYGL